MILQHVVIVFPVLHSYPLNLAVSFLVRFLNLLMILISLTLIVVVHQETLVHYRVDVHRHVHHHDVVVVVGALAVDCLRVLVLMHDVGYSINND